MMNALGLIIIAGFGTVGILAGPNGDHSSKFCYQCHRVDDPRDCNTIEKCWPESYCGMEALTVNGRLQYHLGCFEADECDPATPLIGKRAHGPHHEQVQCRKCCDTENCNRNLCSTGAGHLDTCKDHEEDGFSCSLYNKATICTETDPTTYSYHVAHTKCPKYCGICHNQVDVTTTTAAPQPDTTTAAHSQSSAVTSTACVDDERDGFLCANFDLFHFCTDTTSFAYPLAIEKCRKHCGFCLSYATTTTATLKPVDVMTTTATLKPVDVMTTTATLKPVDVMTTTATLKPVHAMTTTATLKPVHAMTTTATFQPDTTTEAPLVTATSTRSLTTSSVGGMTIV